MNYSLCLSGYSTAIFGIPAVVTLCLTVPCITTGMLMNTYVLVLLVKQKRAKSNQDIYVITLSIFGWIMIAPCLSFAVYADWVNCYDAPQLVTDIRILLSQLCAGMNIWIVFFISLDRLLMVMYQEQYVLRETRIIILIKLIIVFAFYTLICACINFSAYIFNDTEFSILLPNPNYRMAYSFKEWPNRLSQILNVIRMFTDRVIPYVLCTSTYALVFLLRSRRKMIIRPENGEPKATMKKIRAEERYRRSRRLVLGVSVTLFVCLGPETVMDLSEYAFGHPLRTGPYTILGVLWYLQNISNPAICIFASPTLLLASRRIWRKTLVLCGCAKDTERVHSSRDSVKTVFGTSVQLQRMTF